MRLLGAYSLDTSKILKLILGNALIREIETVEGSVLRIRSQLEANLLLKEYEWDTFELIVAMLHHVSSGSLREQRLIQGIIRKTAPTIKESNQSLWRQDFFFPKFMLLVDELRKYRKQSENRNSEFNFNGNHVGTRNMQRQRWDRTEDERISFLSEMHEMAEREIKRRESEKMNRFISNLYVEWANLSIPPLRLRRYAC